MSKTLGLIYGVHIKAARWYERLMFWKYKRVAKGIWIEK